MIIHYPYYNSSYYRYFPNYTNQNVQYNKHISSNENYNFEKNIPNRNNINRNHNIANTKKENVSKEDRQYFDVFGIKLYFDDILLISLIFFLYSEGLQDPNLFICLILLLLS